jgi:hypothetical protein
VHARSQSDDRKFARCKKHKLRRGNNLISCRSLLREPLFGSVNRFAKL